MICILRRKLFNNFHGKVGLSCVVLFLSLVGQAETLTLDSYLGQVRSKNQTFEASTLTTDAASEKTADAEMVYAPTVFATIQGMQDKKELSPVSQRGSKTDYLQASGGMSKLTEWGTAAKVTYSTSQTYIKDTEARYVPEPSWFDGSTTFEVSHPLWKNSAGKNVRSAVEIQKTQSQITALSEALKRKLTLTEAEGVYWRLVIARESLKTAKENLDRSKRIVDWNRKRVQSELADNADLIQAQALADIRDLELTIAQDEERSAIHAFNTARGNVNDAVSEELVRITPELIDQIPVPARKGEREDVQLAQVSEGLSDLSMNLADDKYDPSLDVFATYTLNGRDPETRSKAMSESLSNKFPTWVLGLKFSAPIGGETSSRVRGGYAKDKQASSLLAQRKRFESDREWLELTRKLEESKSRLKLVQKVERTQGKKLDAERERQRKGRSTMFQVMQYETDLAQSQLNVIRNKTEILGIIARMKTFGGQI